MKPNRTLILLLMVFVALAAVVAYQNAQRQAELSRPIPLTNAVFSSFVADDIQAIRLRSPESGESFSIVRAGDGTWTSDSSGTLVQDEANGIARTMVAMTYDGSFTLPEGQNLTTYGFTPEGVLSVEIVLSSGESHAVAVGYRTPTEENYYAIVDDRTEVYLILRAPVDYLISRLKSPPIA
jgi:hypothetical protein